MDDPSTGLCVGLDWSAPQAPTLRIQPARAREPSRLVPVTGGLRFRIAEPGARYCCGWFDFTGAAVRHRACSAGERLTGGRQCRRCRDREGFVMVHQAHRSLAALPRNVAGYMAQPHWLYLDVFADGSLKVGTVSEARFHDRVCEQGPVAACYVGRSGDGVDVRWAESAVAERFGLAQAVSGRRKLAGVRRPVDVTALTARLDSLAADVRAYLGELGGDRVRAVGAPRWWDRPPLAESLLAAAPLVEYPEDLSQGDHSLFVTGLSGSIAMFSVSEDDDAHAYVADLAELRGRRMTFGAFSSTVGAVQPGLF